MLRPLVVQNQHPVNSDRLRLDDVTPVYNAQTATGGYGAPNIARTQVDFVIVSLKTPQGSTWTTGPLYWKPSAGSLDLYASDFKAVDTNDTPPIDPCDLPDPDVFHHKSGLAFTDGLNELSYEVWGKVGVPAVIASYHLALKIWNMEEVWVRRMGVWANITQQGDKDVRGNWSWSQLDTPIVYEEYELRVPLAGNSYRIVNNGLVRKVVLPTTGSPMTTTTESRFVGGTSIRFLLTGVVDRQLAKLAKNALPSPMDTHIVKDRLIWLALARQQLDTMKQEKIADEGAPFILSAVQTGVSYLLRQPFLRYDKTTER